MLKVIVTFLGILFGSFWVFSQCSTYERVYSDPFAYFSNGLKIISLRLGGHLVLGKHKTHSLSNPQISLRKIDTCGNEIWVSYLNGGDPDSRSPVSLLELKDGGFVYGYTEFFYGNNGSMRLTKANSIGQLVWSKLIGNPQENIFVLSISSLPSDSGIYILGKIFSSSEQYDFFIEKRSINGDSLWRKYYLPQDTVLNVQEQKMLNAYDDTSLMVCGGHMGQAYLFRVNSVGDSLSSWFFSDSALALTASNWSWTADSAIVIGGDAFLVPFGYAGHSFVIKSDTMGNRVWEKRLPYPGTSSVYRSICSSVDSGIFVAQYFSTCDQFGNIIIEKLNRDGDSIWAQCYGNPMYSRFSAIGQGIMKAADDGFIFVGSADMTPLNTGAFTHYVYVVKADSLGNFSSSLNVNPEFPNYGEIGIYPNPSSTNITINNLMKQEKIEIFNCLGKLVLSFVTLSTSETISVSELISGLYFVKTSNRKPIKFIKLDE